MQQTLKQEAQQEANRLSEQLLEYVMGEQFRHELIHSEEMTTHDVVKGNFEATELKAKEIIYELISQKIKAWSKGEHITESLSRLAKRFNEECKLSEEMSEKVRLLIDGDPVDSLVSTMKGLLNGVIF